jgi:hypothetical protein
VQETESKSNSLELSLRICSETAEIQYIAFAFFYFWSWIMNYGLLDCVFLRMLLTACYQARCSNTVPCVLCQKLSVECIFNYDRQRRGPHPKINAKDITVSAALDSSPDKTQSHCSNKSALTPRTIHILERASSSPDPILLAEDEETRLSPSITGQQAWQQSVRDLMMSQNGSPKSVAIFLRAVPCC